MKHIISASPTEAPSAWCWRTSPAGVELDMDFIRSELARRAPGRNALSTARREADEPRILSGVFEGKTTGAPLCAVIENTDTRSKDYPS